MFVGFGTLQSKTIGKVGSSVVQAFKVEGELDRLIGGVVVGQEDGKALLTIPICLIWSCVRSLWKTGAANSRVDRILVW